MWAEAYLEQARSDWQLWESIRKQKVPSCHVLHHLQVTCEKLGKAFLIAGKTMTPQQASASHLAFRRFLQVASRNRTLRSMLKMTPVQLRAHIKTLLPLADEIELITPALAQGGPNVEYPWEGPDKQIYSPVYFEFPVFDNIQQPTGANLIKLIDLVLQNFYHIFTKPQKQLSKQN